MNNDAEPVLLEGDERGVLCIHGFTGTPFEVKALASSMHERGPTVRVLRLPGHCTTPRELSQTTWQQWVECVESEYRELQARCPRVFVAGQSLGGLLALNLARPAPDGLTGLAVLAAPLWLPRLPTAVIAAAKRYPALVHRFPNLPKLGGSDVRDHGMRKRNPSYRVVPTRALLELVEFMEDVRRGLPDVAHPLLVVHSRRDHTAPFACAEEIVRRVSSSSVRSVHLEESYHLIAFDKEHTMVADEVWRFAEPLLAG